MTYIGIDTSNYTTSLAAVSDSGVVSVRRLLEVKEGERGIRQSDGVFMHLKQLPVLYKELARQVDFSDVKAVGVSAKPRNVEGSYMPVFLAGHGYARVIADTLGVEFIEFSHQDGHIMAGIYSADCYDLLSGEFLSVHLSGGTTEILKSEYKSGRFVNEITGGTKDISAGQLIDRVGVKMGMRFPAGKHMEKAANDAEGKIKLPVSTNGSYINFSGAETKALSFCETESTSEISHAVFMCVAKTLEKSINHAINEHGTNRVLIVGGVASNSIIRKYLSDNINGSVFFADREYSTDNAAGVALLTKKFAENGYGAENRNSITD